MKKKITTFEHHEIDEREHTERELKKKKDRRLELERLRADVRALEMAEEEEILELRRKIAAANRRNTLPMAQPSKNKRSTTLLDAFEDEREEEELERKANPRRSPGGPHRTSETFTDDDSEVEPPRRSKMKSAGRKLSSTPPQNEDAENQSTDEENSPPPKTSPKVAGKPDTPQVDDLMAQFQRFVSHLGSNPHGSHGSPMYYPPYGSPPPTPVPNNYGYGYGYGGVAPGRAIINSTIGKITNSNVSNIGNDNSVYRKLMLLFISAVALTTIGSHRSTS